MQSESNLGHKHGEPETEVQEQRHPPEILSALVRGLDVEELFEELQGDEQVVEEDEFFDQLQTAFSV